MAYTTIDKGSKYFNTVLYTGTGASLANTGVGFQPDWTWIKQRSTTGGHRVYDVIRGATDTLYTNQTYASAVESQTLTSFNSDGFTVGTDSGVNGSGVTFVAWNWDANGTGVSNTAGSISSTISANTTSGFSIVSYTGTGATGTVGHGLGVAPKMVIYKNRSSSTFWYVYHKDIGNNFALYLNATNAKDSDPNVFQSTDPSSSLLFVGVSPNVNGSGNNIIAYCFAEVKGFSKFGSYTGNGSTDGTFVYTGFFPAFVMIKETSGSGAWRIYDSKRGQGGDNIGGNYKNALMANVSDVEESGATNNIIDSLSNGFKCRYSFDDTNGSGGSYIYMAFANSPFVSSKGIPTTAR